MSTKSLKALKKPETKAEKEKRVADEKFEWLSPTQEWARKHRSPNLEAVIGQDLVKTTIRGFVKRRRIPGAILIYGPFGTGKTTIARIIAKIANCKNIDDSGIPCDACESCKSISDDKSQGDYMELNVADKTGVEDMRRLEATARYKPRGRKRVIVLDESHRLSHSAQDMLLKVLGDNPLDHVIWILCTTDQQSIKPALASRCTKFRLSEVEPKHITGLLADICKKENAKVPKEVLELIASKSDGHVRTAIKNLESVVSAQAVGALPEKIDVDSADKHISEMLGIPNYLTIQHFLCGIYSGKVVTGIEAMFESTMSVPVFLKGCIDVHNNVLLSMLSKNPDRLVFDPWARRYTAQIRKDSGLKRDNLEALTTMSAKMIDTYTKISQYQLGDSSAPLVNLALESAMEFSRADD